MADERRNYGAGDLAEDLKNNVEEIATEVEMTLNETRPEDFSPEAWEAMREAVREARRTLREMLEQIERKRIEAEEYDPEADGERYETYWA